MGAVAKAVTSTVSSVVGAVGDAVQDVGKAVEKVGETVVKAVDQTIQAAKNDPLAAIANVAAIAMAPATGGASLVYLSGFTAANTLAKGGSLEQALTNAAVSYAASTVGGTVDPGYSSAALNASARGAAAGATSAALRGGDVATGALAGGINSGINTGLGNAVNDFANGAPYTPPQQDANAPDNIDAGGGYNPATNGGDFAPVGGLPTDANAPDNIDVGGGYNPAGGALATPDAERADNIDIGGGYNPATGTGDQATADAAAFTGLTSSAYDAHVAPTTITLPKVNWAGALGIGGGQAPMQTPTIAPLGAQSAKTNAGYKDPSLLNSADITGDSTGDPFELQRLKQLYSSLTPEMQNLLQTNNGQTTGQPLTMADGGSTSAWDKLVDSAYNTKASSATAAGQPFYGGGQRRIAQLTPLQQMQKGIVRTMATGGALPARHHPNAPNGHNPEFITGETGYYATGRGTGQSDDIPAMLRHGDYVVDADTVAALGDGSSKAGAEVLESIRKKVPTHYAKGGSAAGASIPAQIADGEYVFPAEFVTALGSGDNARGAKILDGMRHKIREHKRSAPVSKIPPKAKSPLEYIKMASKG